jgi:hypothetical protein
MGTSHFRTPFLLASYNHLLTCSSFDVASEVLISSRFQLAVQERRPSVPRPKLRLHETHYP